MVISPDFKVINSYTTMQDFLPTSQLNEKIKNIFNENTFPALTTKGTCNAWAILFYGLDEFLKLIEQEECIQKEKSIIEHPEN